MNLYNETTPQPADIDRRTMKQVSRGIDYGQYVFAYGRRHGVAWFGFGFALALAMMFLDSRVSGYSYDAVEWVVMPLVFGVLFGAPVFSFALMKRRDQYDYWADSTIEIGNERATAAQPVREKIRPYERIQNGNGTSNQYRIGKHKFDTTLLQQWANTVLSRVDSDGQPDYRIVRDQIPAKLFPGDVKKQWTDLSIQRELVSLGWAQWRYGKEGSNEAIDLTENGVDRFVEFANSPTP